jgi:hypothetical protein
MLADMEAQDASDLHLTAEQAAEAERRLADPNRRFLTREEVRSTLRASEHEGHHPGGRKTRPRSDT